MEATERGSSLCRAGVSLELQPLPTLRGRRSSWEHMPQHLRGIRLRELFDICEEHRHWLEEVRWRCNSCSHSCGCEECRGRTKGSKRAYLCRTATDYLLSDRPGQHGPCLHCGATRGSRQMRNLYEVNAEIIKPRCEPQRISYVEALRIQEVAGTGDPRAVVDGVRVDTFVSHWWGEEFPMMVRTLKKYAKWRCDAQLLRKREAQDWSFWICAFANNQFAVEHATGLNGDVSTSAFAVALQNCSEMVAVIDPEAMIYTRVWCTFELFYAHELPHKPKISLANAGGVISAGAATRATVMQMNELLSTVRVSEARATVQEDHVMIMNALKAAGIETTTLDDILRNQVEEGLRMVCLRAKLFSQLACHFLCLMVAVMVFLHRVFPFHKGFALAWSWYLEWATLLHIPVLCGTCVLFVFLVLLSFSGARGRSLAVDWMWLFGGLGPTMRRAILKQDVHVKLLGCWAVLNSIITVVVVAYAEWQSGTVPKEGDLHHGPVTILAIFCSVLSLETFVLDVRLSPDRFRCRLVAIHLTALGSGALAGLFAHVTSNAIVLLLVVLSWILVFCAAFLRDHATPSIRRRIEEPFWS